MATREKMTSFKSSSPAKGRGKKTASNPAKDRVAGQAEAATSRLREKVERLLDASYAFMDSAQFKLPNIEGELFMTETESPLPLTSWYQPTRDEAIDPSAVGTLQLMSPQEERLMFLRYNYCKFRLTQIQESIRQGTLTRSRAEAFLKWHRRYEHFREYLVRTNLALVLAMAKRTRLGEVDFADIVSEGNLALIRAVEKFNVDRGFKFSTYACRAIIKALGRTAMKASKRKSRFPVEFEPDMERSHWQDRRRDEVVEDCIDELKSIVEGNLADLSKVEQTVVLRRFNWQQEDEHPLTLEEVGRLVGLTKERVRQIQNVALSKIRAVMEQSVLRAAPVGRQ